MTKTASLIILCATFLGITPTLAQQQQPASGTGENYETRLSTLEDEIRSLNGRIEQLEFANRTLNQTVQRLQTDLEARMTALESARQAPPQPPVATITAMPPQVLAQTQVQQPQTQASTIVPITPAGTGPAAPPSESVNGTLGSLTMQNGRVTGSSDNPQTPALPAAPADYGLSPREQYDRAFSLLRQANYDEAEKAFKSFIDKNPKDKLIDNAKYWYGETLYVRGRFDESAVAFAEAYQQNPQGSKAPDSLLKLAMSLANINKLPDACTTLVELKSKFPTAPSALRARADEERTKLQCTIH